MSMQQAPKHGGFKFVERGNYIFRQASFVDDSQLGFLFVDKFNQINCRDL